eukprot:COSAG05_NODE_3052_length_2381_cov_3.333041_2_plen_294_part_00
MAIVGGARASVEQLVLCGAGRSWIRRWVGKWFGGRPTGRLLQQTREITVVRSICVVECLEVCKHRGEGVWKREDWREHAINVVEPLLLGKTDFIAVGESRPWQAPHHKLEHNEKDRPQVVPAPKFHLQVGVRRSIARSAAKTWLVARRAVGAVIVDITPCESEVNHVARAYPVRLHSKRKIRGLDVAVKKTMVVQALERFDQLPPEECGLCERKGMRCETLFSLAGFGRQTDTSSRGLLLLARLGCSTAPLLPEVLSEVIGEELHDEVIETIVLRVGAMKSGRDITTNVVAPL